MHRNLIIGKAHAGNSIARDRGNLVAEMRMLAYFSKMIGNPFSNSRAPEMPLESVTINSTIPAFVGGEKGAPAVIVIQEWWGVTPMIKAHAEMLSSKLGGARVLIPDIYKGKLGVDKEEAHHLMSNLDFPQAVKEICEAAAFLKAEGSPKVGVVGFCMGGALTMGGLAASPDISCGAPFYGVNFGLFDAAQLKDKPVQGHFGAEDKMTGFSDPETGKKLESALKEAGNGEAEVFIYDGVGHAFMNSDPAPFKSFEERQEAMGFAHYDNAQAELAWGRLVSFFEKHLK